MKRMRQWHTYLGLVTALLVMLVSVTGILLIHKKDLGLNRLMVSLPGYGKKVPPDAWSLVTTAGGARMLSTKQGVYVEVPEGWQCVLQAGAKKLIVDGDVLYACTMDGLRQSSDGGRTWQIHFPDEEVKAFLVAGGSSTVATTKGIYRLEGDGSGWKPLASFGRKHLDVRDLMFSPDGLLLAAKEGVFRVAEDGTVTSMKLPQDENRLAGVEAQKVIADLHTGAIFGTWFIYVVDLAALSLIFLSVSGIWLWYRPWRAKRSARASSSSPAATGRS